MASFLAEDASSSADELLFGHMNTLLNDSPKLQTALKNIIAILLGSDFSRRSCDDAIDGKITDIKAFDLLIVSKSLIKAIAQMNLPEAPEWGALHPQLENQTFEQRLDEISQYKAACMFLKKAKATEKIGLSKIIGKHFFVWTKCMDALREILHAFLTSKVEDGIVTLFMDTFDNSIKGND